VAKKKFRTPKPKKINMALRNKHIDERIRQLFPGLILGIEQKVGTMAEELVNLKGNLITTTSLLEKHKVIGKAEFFAEYQRYMNEEGLVDQDGKMDGAAIMTIYNEET
jgi:hypothetical protein